MQPTRRTVLAGIGTTLAIGGGATQVFGQQNDSPTFKVLNVSTTEDTVSFYNNSDGSVDLSGWAVDFEYGSGSTDETGTIPEGTTVGAYESIRIASGAGETDGADVVVQPPFDEKVIKRNGSDVIALLDSDGNEVANSEDDLFIGGSGSGGDDDTSTTTTEEQTTTDETTTTDEGTTTDESTTTTDNSDETTTTTTDNNDKTTTTDGGDSDKNGSNDGSSGSDETTQNGTDDC